LFKITASVILALIMVFLMSKRTENDDDPVWQTTLEVDRLAIEIEKWETNLWSLWAMALVENLFIRLDDSARLDYLNKLENMITELQQEFYKNHPMSDEMPYFETNLNNFHEH